ncbi:hypothetical protein ACFORG_21640 [Lutimaribacter marinistellae]|uniref:Uncharacterized protein n=1 Tax=Lutimaribacter marinistellae TaxID=1820329 RepID=A0ABV7TMX6_9RHOB
MRAEILTPAGSALRWIVGLVVTAILFAATAGANEIEPFVGSYVGSAELRDADGTVTPRDMSVDIAALDDGFTVSWTTTTYKTDGRVKEQAYSLAFLPSAREGVFSAAMKRNVFGHAVQLDPMKGEPFVWGRIDGETLTVYSLFIDDDGGYELQQYDRTLADGGLNLSFTRIRNGEEARSVETFLRAE